MYAVRGRQLVAFSICIGSGDTCHTLFQCLYQPIGDIDHIGGIHLIAGQGSHLTDMAILEGSIQVDGSVAAYDDLDILCRGGRARQP